MSHGPLMLDLQGPEMTPEERERLLHPAAGGVILFSRNYEDPAQLAELVAAIHGLRRPPLLVAVDQEGGRVQRFREGFSELPPAAALGALHRRDPHLALEAARHLGWLMATELRTTGVDFSFAPVLDLQTEESRVIGDRAFSPDPLVVSRLAFAWARGAREGGMASVGKHFPGHGNVAEDSHHELPRDPRPFEEIWNHDLLPFRHMVENNLEGIMPAHVVYEHCDPLPAGYSPFWIGEVLRERMGFQGVVFSDDLSMAAAEVAGDPAQRAVAALEAGCDMVLVCNDPAAAGAVLDELSECTDPVRQVRMARMHGTHALSREEIHEDPRWPRAMEFLALLDAETHGDLDLELES